MAMIRPGVNTRYGGLNGSGNPVRAEKEYYKGIWNGRLRPFDRMFRNHRFSDEECDVLFMGKIIEVHNLTRNGRVYAVKGKLREIHDMFTGEPKLVFDTIDTVPNRIGYRFGDSLYGESDKKSDKNKKAGYSDVVLDDNDLDGIVFDEGEDLRKQLLESQAREAALAAMVDSESERSSEYDSFDDNPFGDTGLDEEFDGISDVKPDDSEIEVKPDGDVDESDSESGSDDEDFMDALHAQAILDSEKVLTDEDDDSMDYDFDDADLDIGVDSDAD